MGQFSVLDAAWNVRSVWMCFDLKIWINVIYARSECFRDGFSEALEVCNL